MNAAVYIIMFPDKLNYSFRSTFSGNLQYIVLPNGFERTVIIADKIVLNYFWWTSFLIATPMILKLI